MSRTACFSTCKRHSRGGCWVSGSSVDQRCRRTAPADSSRGWTPALLLLPTPRELGARAARNTSGVLDAPATDTARRRNGAALVGCYAQWHARGLGPSQVEPRTKSAVRDETHHPRHALGPAKPQHGPRGSHGTDRSPGFTPTAPTRQSPRRSAQNSKSTSTRSGTPRCRNAARVRLSCAQGEEHMGRHSACR